MTQANHVEIEGEIIKIENCLHNPSVHVHIVHKHPEEEEFYPWNGKESHFRLTFKNQAAKDVIMDINPGKKIQAKGFLIGQLKNNEDKTGDTITWIQADSYLISQ